MKKTTLLLAFFSLVLFTNAQTPVGKWKFHAAYSETVSRVRTNMLKNFTQDDPCMIDAVLSISTDGKIMIIDKCVKDIVPEFVTLWKIESKGKITLISGDRDMDRYIYDLEIKSNKMRWTMIFPDRPNSNNSEDIRLFVLEFTKA